MIKKPPLGKPVNNTRTPSTGGRPRPQPTRPPLNGPPPSPRVGPNRQLPNHPAPNRPPPPNVREPHRPGQPPRRRPTPPPDQSGPKKVGPQRTASGDINISETAPPDWAPIGVQCAECLRAGTRTFRSVVASHNPDVAMRRVSPVTFHDLWDLTSPATIENCAHGVVTELVPAKQT